jgi:hypothetical protein
VVSVIIGEKGSLIFPGTAPMINLYSSETPTLAAHPTHNRSHWPSTVTSGISNAFLTATLLPA